MNELLLLTWGQQISCYWLSWTCFFSPRFPIPRAERNHYQYVCECVCAPFTCQGAGNSTLLEHFLYQLSMPNEIYKNINWNWSFVHFAYCAFHSLCIWPLWIPQITVSPWSCVLQYHPIISSDGANSDTHTHHWQPFLKPQPQCNLCTKCFGWSYIIHDILGTEKWVSFQILGAQCQKLNLTNNFIHLIPWQGQWKILRLSRVITFV